MPIMDYGSVDTVQNGFPRLLKEPMITLNMDPEGNTNVEVRNPMHSYEFPITTGVDYTGQGRPAASANPLMYVKGQRSVRYPTADDSQKENVEGEFHLTAL